MAGEENSTVEPAAAADPNAIHLQLDVFEGPLDLLLHLIRAHELDIFDIPISFVTEKYLHYLNMMRELHIDVASEFLVMAATLAHIKSKMLLPRDATDDGDDESEDPLDPRTELVRRLLEYQKYKDAAHGLASRSALGRDVFERGTSEPVPKGPAPLAPGNIFRLFDAFEQVLKRANQTADHKVLFERVSISERIMELTELLHDRSRLPFAQLFEDAKATPSRLDLIITFLALLEMCKLQVIRVSQDDPLDEMLVEFAPKRIAGDAELPAAEFRAEPTTGVQSESYSEPEPTVDTVTPTAAQSESKTEAVSERVTEPNATARKTGGSQHE